MFPSNNSKERRVDFRYMLPRQIKMIEVTKRGLSHLFSTFANYRKWPFNFVRTFMWHYDSKKGISWIYSQCPKLVNYSLLAFREIWQSTNEIEHFVIFIIMHVWLPWKYLTCMGLMCMCSMCVCVCVCVCMCVWDQWPCMNSEDDETIRNLF